MAASFLHIAPTPVNKGTCLFYLQKNKTQYKHTSKEYPADTWFSSNHSVYQAAIYQAGRGIV